VKIAPRRKQKGKRIKKMKIRDGKREGNSPGKKAIPQSDLISIIIEGKRKKVRSKSEKRIFLLKDLVNILWATRLPEPVPKNQIPKIIPMKSSLP